MLIFLIGFMGSGKTTTGKSLSRLLDMEFIDMDDYIVQETKMSINKIFEIYGEKWFRDKETATLKQLCNKKDVIIATGGGAPCFNDNMSIIKKNGVSFYLQLSPKALANRVYNPKTERPLLKDKSKDEIVTYAETMLQKREPFYRQAHYIIDALNLKPETIAKVIRMNIDEEK